MIPSFKPGIMSSNRIAGGNCSGDVTPNAVNWNTGFSNGTEITTDSQIISGISSAINIFYSCVYCGDGGDIYYSINSGSWVLIQENTNFSVSNGQDLKWKYQSGPGAYKEIDIRNACDGNAILQTIPFQNEL